MSDELTRNIKAALSARRPSPSRDLAARLAAARPRSRPRFIVPAALALSVAALALVVLATRPHDPDDRQAVVLPAGSGAERPAGPPLDPDRLPAYQALLDNPGILALAAAQRDKILDAALELARQRVAHLETKRLAEIELRKELAVAEPDPARVTAAFERVAAEDTAVARAELVARLAARAVLDPAQRAQIENGKSPPALATLEVHSTNPGQVEIDGKPVGTTPLLLQVAPGKHVVRVDYAGHESGTRTVELGSGSRTVLDVEPGGQVHAGTGTLYITASPYTTVTIDGRVVGETPVKVSLLAGTHKIVMTAASGHKQSRVVTVEAGKTQHVTAELGDNPYE